MMMMAAAVNRKRSWHKHPANLIHSSQDFKQGLKQQTFGKYNLIASS
jgi:hypothetical protein